MPIPRPHIPQGGEQIKSLKGSRWPQGSEEWTALRAAIEGVKHVIREDSSVDSFYEDLQGAESELQQAWTAKVTKGERSVPSYRRFQRRSRAVPSRCIVAARPVPQRVVVCARAPQLVAASADHQELARYPGPPSIC